MTHGHVTFVLFIHTVLSRDTSTCVSCEDHILLYVTIRHRLHMVLNWFILYYSTSVVFIPRVELYYIERLLLLMCKLFRYSYSAMDNIEICYDINRNIVWSNLREIFSPWYLPILKQFYKRSEIFQSVSIFTYLSRPVNVSRYLSHWFLRQIHKGDSPLQYHKVSLIWRRNAFGESLHGVGGFGDDSHWCTWKRTGDPGPNNLIRKLPLICWKCVV